MVVLWITTVGCGISVHKPAPVQHAPSIQCQIMRMIDNVTRSQIYSRLFSQFISFLSLYIQQTHTVILVSKEQSMNLWFYFQQMQELEQRVIEAVQRAENAEKQVQLLYHFPSLYLFHIIDFNVFIYLTLSCGVPRNKSHIDLFLSITM